MKKISLYLILLIFIFMSCQETSSKMETDVNSDPAYTESHRPQFHFTPPAKWMNDPNGMVYYDGEYHLFYQHYPDSTVWGPMHWGHAVSKDLVHWEHLPIALYPDSLGYIFSGSAVVDHQNTAGFKEGEESPLVAIFTYHDPIGAKAGTNTFQYQGIAYSNDKGRTWIKYEGNPVVPNPGIRDFRDPKVFWHKASQQWVMIFAAWDRVRLYNSPNLKDWTFTSEFGAEWGSHGGVWECPDLFELKVDGTDESKWVMLLSINPGGPNGGSATQYFVGDFDGKTFTLNDSFAESVKPENTGNPEVKKENAQWLDFGRDNYAGVTWSDIPKEDGRRLFLGWMSNWNYANVVPTEVWRSAMTVPRSLHLERNGESYRLLSRPVEEFSVLREQSYEMEETTVDGFIDLSKKFEFTPTTSELLLEFEIPEGKTPDFGVELSNDEGDFYRIGLDVGENQYYSDRTQAGKKAFSAKFATDKHWAPRLEKGQIVKMHLFIDVASLELFADDGATVMTEIFFPTKNFTQLKISSQKGRVKLKSGKIYELKSIW